MSIKVSSSLKGEFSRIKELFPAIQAETRYKDFSINYEKLENLYYNQFDENPIIKVFYALDGDELVGFGAFVITAHYFTDELIASDIIVYVRPERRGSSAAVKILKNYILWADQQKATHITLGISTGIHPEKTQAFYERLGFKTIGTMHCLE
jgi:GNAT superfamily N-acetyltransferase